MRTLIKLSVTIQSVKYFSLFYILLIWQISIYIYSDAYYWYKTHLFIFSKVYLQKSKTWLVPSFERLRHSCVCLTNGRHKPFRFVRRVWPCAAFYYSASRSLSTGNVWRMTGFCHCRLYPAKNRTSKDRHSRNIVSNNSILNENYDFVSRHIKCRFDRIYYNNLKYLIVFKKNIIQRLYCHQLYN